MNPHCVARRRLGRVVQQGHVGERGGVPACEHVGVDAEPVGVRRHDRSGRPVAGSPVLVDHGLQLREVSRPAVRPVEIAGSHDGVIGRALPVELVALVPVALVAVGLDAIRRKEAQRDESTVVAGLDHELLLLFVGNATGSAACCGPCRKRLRNAVSDDGHEADVPARPTQFGGEVAGRGVEDRDHGVRGPVCARLGFCRRGRRRCDSRHRC